MKRITLIFSCTLLAACSTATNDESGARQSALSAFDNPPVDPTVTFPLGIYIQASPENGPNDVGAPNSAADNLTWWLEIERQLASWGLTSTSGVNFNSDDLVTQSLVAGDILGNVDVIPNLGRDDLDAAAFAAPHPSHVLTQGFDEPHGPTLLDARRYGLLRGAADPTRPAPFSVTCWPPSDWCVSPTQFDCQLGAPFDALDLYPANGGSWATWTQGLDAFYEAVPSDKEAFIYLEAFQNSLNETTPPTIPYPTPRQMAYEANSALAHGFKGIFWFEYNLGTGVIAFDGTARSGLCVPGSTSIVNCNLQAPLQTILPHVAALKPWLLDAYRDDANKSYVHPTRRQTLSPTISAPGCEATTFTTRSNEKLAMLVLSWQATAATSCAATYSETTTLPKSVRVYNVETQQPLPLTFPAANQVTFSDTLNPGEGRLYRFVPAFSADIRVPPSGYTNPVSPGQTTTLTVTLTNRGDPLAGGSSWGSETHLGVKLYPEGVFPAVAGSAAQLISGVSGNTISGAVAPGQSTTLNVTIPTTLMTTPGSYTLGLDLYRDDGTWADNEQQLVLMVQPNPLLVDTFDTPPLLRPADYLGNWQADGGGSGWGLTTILEGALAVNGENGRVSVNGGSWTDYTLEMDVMLDAGGTAGANSIGWLFRASDGQNGYLARLSADSQNLELYTLIAGQRGGTPIGSFGVPGGVHAGRWYHVRTTVSGTTIAINVNGTGASWQDATFAGGRVGFFAAEGSGDPSSGAISGLQVGHYDNVSVFTAGVPAAAGAVTGLAAQNGGSAGVRLRWSAVRNAAVSHYCVYRSGSSGTRGGIIARPAGVSFSDGSVTLGTPYFYSVGAATVAGDCQDATVSAQTSGTASLAAPVTNLVASAPNMKTVDLGWTASASPVDHYDIFRSTSPTALVQPRNRIGCAGLNTALACNGLTTTYVDTANNVFVSDAQQGVRPFTHYYYAVVPVDSAAVSGTAAQTTVTPPGANANPVAGAPLSSLFSDSFTNGTGNWTLNGGNWTVSNGQLVQSLTTTALSSATANGRAWQNSVFEVQITELSNGGSDANWAGIVLRKPIATSNYFQSGGYLVYMQANGELVLYDVVDGAVAYADPGLGSVINAPHTLRVETIGYRIRVFLDGVKYIEWLDPHSRYFDGYFDLATSVVTATFTNVNVYMRDPFIYSGADGWGALSGTAYNISNEFLTMGDGVANAGALSLTGFSAADFTADFDVSIEKEATWGDWVGMTIRKNNWSDHYWDSGYLIALRADGFVFIYDRYDGSVFGNTVPGTPTGHLRHVRVSARDNRIQVFVDGALGIDWTDTHRYFRTGTFDLAVDSAQGRYSGISIY